MTDPTIQIDHEIAAEGTNLYYATLFDTIEHKTIIINLHALLYELTDIIRKCSDLGIARIKLKWWQEEFERLFQQKPQHLLSHKLQQTMTFNEAIIHHLKEIAQNIEHFLLIEPIDSLDDILSFYRQAHGQLWQQCALLLGDDQTKQDDIVETAALYHLLVCLQQPQTYINGTRCIIPKSYHPQINLFELKQQQTACLTPLLAQIKTMLDKNYQDLAKALPAVPKHVLILNRLATKTSEKILNDGCHLLDRKLSLMPISKLWIAWRTHVAMKFTVRL